MVLKVIIDVDTGVDDAWGLFLFLTNEDVEVLGITCVHGNTTLQNVCRNTLRVVSLSGKKNVPVFKGAACPLVERDFLIAHPDLEHFHGVNGLGDVELPELPKAAAVQQESAINALNRIAEEHKGEVTLVCFGPLTNVALTTRCYPNFIENLKEVFVMGGNYTAMGNITMCAEFNFHSDPEAAHILMSSSMEKLTLLPWETCLNTKIPYEWRHFLGEGKGAIVHLMNQVESGIMNRARRLGFTNWINCDQLLASLVIDRSIITDSFVTHATIELDGHHTRGQLVMDHLNLRAANITIVKTTDVEKHKSLLLTLRELEVPLQ